MVGVYRTILDDVYFREFNLALTISPNINSVANAFPEGNTRYGSESCCELTPTVTRLVIFKISVTGGSAQSTEFWCRVIQYFKLEKIVVTFGSVFVKFCVENLSSLLTSWVLRDSATYHGRERCNLHAPQRRCHYGNWLPMPETEYPGLYRNLETRPLWIFELRELYLKFHVWSEFVSRPRFGR